MARFQICARLTLVFTLLVMICACSAVVHYDFVGQEHPDLSEIDERLSNVLKPEGFKYLSAITPDETRFIGVTEYFKCQNAGEVKVLEKEWRDFGGYHWVWVHSFRCDGNPKFVVSSSANADTEAKDVRKALIVEFRNEVDSGSLQIKNKPRLPLE